MPRKIAIAQSDFCSSELSLNHKLSDNPEFKKKRRHE